MNETRKEVTWMRLDPEDKIKLKEMAADQRVSLSMYIGSVLAAHVRNNYTKENQ